MLKEIKFILWFYTRNKEKNLKISKSKEFTGLGRAVWSICFSPDGLTLASGHGDSSIRFWDIKIGKEKEHDRLNGHNGLVKCVCYSPDGNSLASCSSNDKYILIWDLKTRKNKKLDAHNKGVNSVCFSSDGTTLASGSNDCIIVIWNVQSRK